MSQINLPGHATAISATNFVINLGVSDNVSLVQVSVSKRAAGSALSGKYDPVLKTATVKLLLADFQSMTNAVANGGQISIDYTYESTTLNVVAFTWLPVAVARTTVSPPSGISASPALTNADAQVG